jgi:hypothetical protein
MMRLSRAGRGWSEIEVELNGSVEVEFFLFIKSYYYSTRMHACVGGIEDNAYPFALRWLLLRSP